jgi:hypothetical protein
VIPEIDAIDRPVAFMKDRKTVQGAKHHNQEAYAPTQMCEKRWTLHSHTLLFRAVQARRSKLYPRLSPGNDIAIRTLSGTGDICLSRGTQIFFRGKAGIRRLSAMVQNLIS